MEFIINDGAIGPTGATNNEWDNFIKNCDSFPKYDAYIGLTGPTGPAGPTNIIGPTSNEEWKKLSVPCIRCLKKILINVESHFKVLKPIDMNYFIHANCYIKNGQIDLNYWDDCPFEISHRILPHPYLSTYDIIRH